MLISLFEHMDSILQIFQKYFKGLFLAIEAEEFKANGCCGFAFGHSFNHSDQSLFRIDIAHHIRCFHEFVELFGCDGFCFFHFIRRVFPNLF